MDGTLSIIHINSRSLYINFFKIKDYMKQFSMFCVIAASETWLTPEKEHVERLSVFFVPMALGLGTGSGSGSG